MNNDRHILTFDEALALIADGDEVHVILNPAPNMLVGADWGRKDLVDALRESKHIELAGPEATRMNHGVAFVHRGDLWFAATKDAPERKA
jgi:hypothetical protein